MSYCHDCRKEFERGTILCPRCGSKLAGETDGETGPSADRSSNESTDDDIGWSTDGSASTDSTTGWSTNDSASDTTATSGHRDSVPTASGPEAPDSSEPRYHDTDVFSFSFAFPFGREGKPLLIDTVVVFFGMFLVVPLLFSYGYSYRVGRAAARGDEEVPAFDDWWGLAKDGLILTALYLGVMVAFGVVIALLVAAITAVGDSSSLVLAIFGIGVLVVLAGFYVAGAIVPVLLGTGRLSETFSDGRILEFAFSIHYLKGVLLLFGFSIALNVAFSVVAFVLVLIPIVGWLLLIALVFAVTAYATNLVFALWGYVYNEAASAGDVTPVEPDASLGMD